MGRLLLSVYIKELKPAHFELVNRGHIYLWHVMALVTAIDVLIDYLSLLLDVLSPILSLLVICSLLGKDILLFFKDLLLLR